jgi:hypothetical protein
MKLMKLEASRSDQKPSSSLYWVCFSILLLTLGAASGCSGQLYRVGSAPKVSAPEFSSDSSGTENGLVIAAHKLTGDELMGQFDANLLLAGVIVVDVRGRNNEGIAQFLTFDLRDDAGVIFQRLEPKKALKMVMKYYGNRLYAQAAYQHTLSQYESLALPQSFLLEASAERRGFLFFATRTDTAALGSLQLVTTGRGTSFKTALP